MKLTPLIEWLCDAASEAVEGMADGFLIVSGGSTAAAAITQNAEMVRTLTLPQLVISMLVAGAWYVAAYVKKNKPPFRLLFAPADSQPPTS